MSQGYDFYTERAEAAAAAAREATLENVRERELRSEKTWRDLANQARSIAVERARTEAEKAAAREAASQP